MVYIDGHCLTLHDIVEVAYGRESAMLAPSGLAAVQQSRLWLEEILNPGERYLDQHWFWYFLGSAHPR